MGPCDPVLLAPAAPWGPVNPWLPCVPWKPVTAEPDRPWEPCGPGGIKLVKLAIYRSAVPYRLPNNQPFVALSYINTKGL